MKKVLFLTLTFLGLILAVNAQNTVTIYNTTFKIKDIAGTTLITDAKYTTPFAKARLENEAFYSQNLGSYLAVAGLWDVPLDLFNLIDRGDYPLLDAINIQYYDEYSLPLLMKDATMRNDATFQKFEQEWDNFPSVKSRKKQLFKSEYYDIGQKIIATRYEIKDVHFDQKKTVEASITTTIQGDVHAILKQYGITADAGMKAYFGKLINNAINIDGHLLVVQLTSNYSNRLSHAISSISENELGNDLFSNNLIEYVKSTEAAAISGFVVLKLNGTYSKSSINVDSIKATLSAKFDPKDVVGVGKAVKASLDIGFYFTNKVTKFFSADINNIYVLEYGTSNMIDKLKFKSTTNKASHPATSNSGLCDLLFTKNSKINATNGSTKVAFSFDSSCLMNRCKPLTMDQIIIDYTVDYKKIPIDNTHWALPIYNASFSLFLKDGTAIKLQTTFDPQTGRTQFANDPVTNRYLEHYKVLGDIQYDPTTFDHIEFEGIAQILNGMGVFNDYTGRFESLRIQAK